LMARARISPACRTILCAPRMAAVARIFDI
jgi:hypothetical protein